jgi:uncharacterized protein YndB with AHSA1/START domain
MSTPRVAREIVERTYNASLALVWELWTTADGLESWYGPVGFRVGIDALEVEPGGRFDCTMHAVAPDKVAWFESQGRPTSWPNHAVFTEVVAQQRLVFELHMPTPDGVVLAVHTVSFTETEAGVRVVLTIEASRAELIAPAAMGWRSAMGRLAELVAAARAS